MGSFTRARADQRGFTLAELLVAIAIVGLVMTGLLTLLMAGNESYLTGSNQVEAQAAIRAALERMTQEIREAGYNPGGLPPCTPPPPLGSACLDPIVTTATGFTIQNDWNGSGAVSPPVPPVVIEPTVRVCLSYTWAPGDAFCPPATVSRGEQITYAVVGGNLTRQETVVDAQPQTLVTSVTQANLGGVQPFFQYLDANGCVIGVVCPTTGAIPTQADIRTVVVNLQVGVQNQPPAIWQAGAIQVTMSDRIRLRNRIP